MKKHISLIAGLLLTLSGWGQAPPQGINYQAVAVDVNGKEIVGVDIQGQPIKDKAIRVRFSIIKNAASGTLAYRETHLTNTDSDGLFNLVIGTGLFDGGSGDFDQIDWGTGVHFLKVEMDIAGGYEFKDMGTMQFWSVPYALYTEKAGNGVESVTDNGDGTTTIVLANGDSITITNGEGIEGPQGPAGPEGPTGPQGIPGEGITNITDNGNGTLTITYGNGDQLITSNLTGPQGPAGATGATGPQGIPGVGITNITDNGNGTLTITYGNGDQLITSNLTGPQGPAGATGATGPQGPQGIQGPAGPAGAQGPQGIQGPAGPQGPAGTNGTNGVSISWLGSFASAPGSPTLNQAYYNTTDGVSYVWNGSSWNIVAQDGTAGGGGGNTLNQAYNQGGPGAGRIITSNAGAVEINLTGGGTTGLLVTSNVLNSFAIDVTQNNTGVGIRSRSLLAGNTFPAIQAETNSSGTTNSAILGQNSGAGYGIAGQIPAGATGFAAVFGNNLRTGGGTGVSGIGFNGIVGETNYSNGIAVYGENYDAIAPLGNGIGVGGVGYYGVVGEDTYLGGVAGAYGVFSVGNLGASGLKTFRIDHPTKPNNYLVHFSMESNEVLNLYRGTVSIDSNGEAVVTLPDYFTEININFSYQLTPVGEFANLYIKEKISGNSFTIAGGTPGMEVCWVVYAERNDAWVRDHPHVKDVEPNKTRQHSSPSNGRLLQKVSQ